MADDKRTVYATTPPEFVGPIPARKEIPVITKKLAEPTSYWGTTGSHNVSIGYQALGAVTTQSTSRENPGFYTYGTDKQYLLGEFKEQDKDDSKNHILSYTREYSRVLFPTKEKPSEVDTLTAFTVLLDKRDRTLRYAFKNEEFYRTHITQLLESVSCLDTALQELAEKVTNGESLETLSAGSKNTLVEYGTDLLTERYGSELLEGKKADAELKPTNPALFVDTDKSASVLREQQLILRLAHLATQSGVKYRSCVVETDADGRDSYVLGLENTPDRLIPAKAFTAFAKEHNINLVLEIYTRCQIEKLMSPQT